MRRELPAGIAIPYPSILTAASRWQLLDSGRRSLCTWESDPSLSFGRINQLRSYRACQLAPSPGAQEAVP